MFCTFLSMLNNIPGIKIRTSKGVIGKVWYKYIPDMKKAP